MPQSLNTTQNNLFSVTGWPPSCCWRNKDMATFDLNGTIGPIIDGVVLLMPNFLNLVVAIVPVVITLAVVGFLIKFWDRILDMINLK